MYPSVDNTSYILAESPNGHKRPVGVISYLEGYDPDESADLWRADLEAWMGLIDECRNPRVTVEKILYSPSERLIVLWDGRERAGTFWVRSNRELEVVGVSNEHIIDRRRAGMVGPGRRSMILEIRERLISGEFVSQEEIKAAFASEMGYVDGQVHVRFHDSKTHDSGIGSARNWATSWYQYVLYVPRGTKVNTDAPLTPP